MKVKALPFIELSEIVNSWCINEYNDLFPDQFWDALSSSAPWSWGDADVTLIRRRNLISAIEEIIEKDKLEETFEKTFADWIAYLTSIREDVEKSQVEFFNLETPINC